MAKQSSVIPIFSIPNKTSKAVTIVRPSADPTMPKDQATNEDLISLTPVQAPAQSVLPDPNKSTVSNQGGGQKTFAQVAAGSETAKPSQAPPDKLACPPSGPARHSQLSSQSPSGASAEKHHGALPQNLAQGAQQYLSHAQAAVPPRVTTYDSSSASGKVVLAQTNHSPQLDIHAKNYIPLWLQAVNDSIATPRTCSPLNSLAYDQYVKSFAGTNILQPLTHSVPPSISRVPFETAISPEHLTRTQYFEYFYECLQNEIATQADDLTRLSMYNLNSQPSQFGPHCYAVIIPGLREDSPRIDLGDVVLCRLLIPAAQKESLAKGWYGPNGGRGRGYCAPGFTGEEYHAVVWGMSRTKEQVILRVDGVPIVPQGCNLSFIVQEHRCTPLFRSIWTTAEELRAWSTGPVESDWIGRMLFPEEKDVRMQRTLPKGAFNLDWYDDELNYEQKKAVDAIVSNQYGNVPFLISGPPGTGKTKTIVETVMQLLENAQESVTPHLLVCAPSDPACDTLALRLSKYLAPKELLRLNNWTRSSAEVPGEILAFTFTENNLFSIPDFQKMMQYKVVVTSCRDADMLVQTRLTNRHLTKLGLETVFAIAPSSILDMKPMLHWTALLIDEAAQATEPEALIPISVVSTTKSPSPSGNAGTILPQFVMAGDEHQLGPQLFLRSSALSTSLFGRLFARSFYADHPLSRRHGSRRLTAALLPIPRPAFTNLVRNYRSHPAILAISSLLFYADTLIPESIMRTPLSTDLPHWKQPYRWPVLFIQSSSPDAFEDIASKSSGISGSALFNNGESHKALKVIEDLLEFCRGSPKPGTKPISIVQNEIAVIAPFRAQVNRLRKLFREEGLSGVNIGPLEAYQGLEFRVVIFCTTRTRLGTDADERGIARFVSEDISWNRGVIGQKKKFNVAMTRAKEALFVIGDERALTCTEDECWKTFLGFVSRNNAVEFVDDQGQRRFEQSSKTWPTGMGRLEAALKYGVEIGDERGRPVRVGQDETAGQNSGQPHSSSRRQQLFQGSMISEDERMISDGIQAQHTIQNLDPPISAAGYRPFSTAKYRFSSESPEARPPSSSASRNSNLPIRPPPGLTHPSRPSSSHASRPPGPTHSSRPSSSNSQSLRPPPGFTQPSLIPQQPGPPHQTNPTEHLAEQNTQNASNGRNTANRDTQEFDRDPIAEIEKAAGETDCATQ